MVSALCLAGCGSKKWTTPIATIDCGTMKLRFEERGIDRGFPSGARSFIPALLMNQGAGWQLVDDIGVHEGPSGYSSLLPPTSGFHVFARSPNGESEDDYHHPPWVIYANPSEINDAQYTALSACIETNLAAIDAAWEKERDPKENFDLATDRRVRISSILHLAHDQPVTANHSFAARRTTDVLWNCPDGTFIKATPPDALDLCSESADVCGQIGRVSRDQTRARLYPWSYLIPATQRVTGPGYEDFYGSCRDAAGRSLYDTLKPVAWKQSE